MNAITIHIAQQDHIDDLNAIVKDMGKTKAPQYFQDGLKRQDQGKANTWIINLDNQPAGYCLLNWEPKYNLYRKLDIPEIQDLNILPAFRRRGLATALIEHCENKAREKGKTQIGISYGLDASYGPAQRLYTKLGYVPDGCGVTYDRAPVRFGNIHPIDDDLCLMMVKELSIKAP